MFIYFMFFQLIGMLVTDKWVLMHIGKDFLVYKN